MADTDQHFVGPTAPVWPLQRPGARIGCSLLIWLLLVLGLALVVFSMGMGIRAELFLDRHSGLIWAGVGLASLTWPTLYLWRGWYRTFYGYWPRDDSLGLGVPCETCGSQMRRGRTFEGHFVCDVCARQRVVDNRRLVAPGVIMVGLAFLGNGVSSLVEHRARELGRLPAAPWEWAMTGPQRDILETIDILGVVGSLGLTVAGILILVRILRHVILAPIGPRSIATARRQIAQGLDREASECREDPRVAER